VILSHAIHAWRVWRRYRACLRQLSALTDMELTDIGLSRSGLHWVAWRVSQDGGAVARPSHIDDR
jgi:uncharacterized protein YjiS (DUF1127 family)